MNLNFFALISLAAMAVNVTMAVFVLSRNPKAMVNRLFALVALSLAWWGFTEAMLRLSVTVDDARVWLYLSAIGFTFVSPLYLHFTLFYVGMRQIAKHPLVLLFLYFPVAFWFFVEWQTDLILVGDAFVQGPWGWDGPPGPFILVFAAWLTGYFLAAIYLLVRFLFQAQNRQLRTQALILLAGLIIPLVSGLTTDVFFPILEISFPNTAVASTTLGGLLVALAILRYRLFVFSPEGIVNEIVDTMSDALFVLNPKGEVQYVNPAVTGLLGFGGHAVVGVHFTALFPGRTSHAHVFREEVMQKLQKGEGVVNFRTALRAQDDQDVLVNISAAPVFGPQGSIFGFVLVARDVREEQQLIDELEASNRQIYDAKVRLEQLAGELLRKPRSA